MVMDEAGDKAIIFAIITGILGGSGLADFCFKHTSWHWLQQIIFWPAVLALVILLLRGKKFFSLRLSWYSLSLFFVLLIGLFFRLYKISALPLNHDEAFTTLRTLFLFQSKDFTAYAGIPLTFVDGKVPALFTMLVGVCAAWCRSPEIIARLPAVIAGLLTIWLTYRLTRELGGKKTALAAAFFLAVFPWHIIQSRVGVSVVLTPCFGVLFFLLFTKAIKKQNYQYFYLAFLTLGISAFWTYTESQIFIILAVILCVVLKKELSWSKSIDILNCILLFIIPLYPFLASWAQAGFVQSQYYHSIFPIRDNLIFGIVCRLAETGKLLFWEKDQFFLFAPGFKGPIIQFFLWLPLVLGVLNIRKARILSAVLSVWLAAGIQFAHPLVELRRRPQHRQLVPELFVLILQTGQAELALFDLPPEFVNLAFLPDVTHTRPANHQTKQERLERRAKANVRRLIFPVSRH